MLSRRAAAIAAAGVTLLTAWAAGMTSYVVFRDEVLAGLARRHQETIRTYEERIAELRSEIERARARRLVDQDGWERKLDTLAKRQSALEARQQTIATLAERTAGQRAAAPPAVPARVTDAAVLRAAPDRESRLVSRPAAAPAAGLVAASGGEGAAGALGRAIDRLELAQADALARIEDQADGRARRIRAAFADIGIVAERFSGEAATGGPFVPLAAPGPFEAQAQRVAGIVADLHRLESAAAGVPLRRPVRGDAEVTSGFGTRLDPFLRQPALHSGIDFRGDTGTPVRATAGGRVREAGHQGGYGNMVEIDHGFGLSTRYAHLSAIDVSEGQTVAAGQVVGRLGSTGRSTGPHLHYETRIEGEAVDPQRFLRAGVRLDFAAD